MFFFYYSFKGLKRLSDFILKVHSIFIFFCLSFIISYEYRFLLFHMNIGFYCNIDLCCFVCQPISREMRDMIILENPFLDVFLFCMLSACLIFTVRLTKLRWTTIFCKSYMIEHYWIHWPMYPTLLISEIRFNCCRVIYHICVCIIKYWFYILCFLKMNI